VGVQNNQTVVYIPSQPDLGLAQQPIATVTEVDARANGKTVADLAREWQTNLRLSLSTALWGHEFDRQYPLARTVFAIAIAAIVWLGCWILHWIHKPLRSRSIRLNQQDRQLTDSLKVDSESRSGQMLPAIADAVISSDELARDRASTPSEEPEISAIAPSDSSADPSLNFRRPRWLFKFFEPIEHWAKLDP
jgi:hypothetical protein